MTGHALTLNWDVGHSALGDLTLRSITARRTMKSRSLSDFDGTPVDLVRFVLNNDYESFTQEVQLLGSGAEFKYTLGGFYSNDSYSVYNPRWNFQRAWPVRWEMSDFDAEKGGASCEVLELAVERVVKG